MTPPLPLLSLHVKGLPSGPLLLGEEIDVTCSVVNEGAGSADAVTVTAIDRRPPGVEKYLD